MTRARDFADVISGQHGLPTGALADDAVTSAKIADDAVVTAAIADDAITSALIADDAITSALINDDAVGSAALDLTADYAFTGTITGAGPSLTDWQSFSSTIKYDTQTSDTSPDQTLTVTAYYIKIGKLVHVSWPTLTRATTFSGTTVIISEATVPLTSANNGTTWAGSITQNAASGYYSSTHMQGAGTFECKLGPNTTAVGLFFKTHNSSANGFILLDGASSSLNFSLTYVASS